MKVSNIKKSGDHYTITLIPTFLEKLFGIKEEQRCYKDTGKEYRFGSGDVLVDNTGKKLPPGNYITKAITLHRQKLYFKEK